MPLQTNHIFRLSILLALLGHLIIFSSVIFVFPLKKASHKPKLIFIGSILQKKALSETKEIFSLKKRTFNSYEKTFQINQKPQDKLSSHFATTKPAIKNLVQTDKVTIKSTFLKSDLHDIEKASKFYQEKPFLEDTPFNPLKLQNDD